MKNKYKFFIKIILFTLMLLVVFAYILFNNNFKDKTIYSTYTYINSNNYNSFNFKYPMGWRVEKYPNEEIGPNEESFPTYGVHIYIDKNRDNVISIDKSLSQNLYFSVKRMNVATDMFKIKQNNGAYAHVIKQGFDDNRSFYTIGFGDSDNVLMFSTSCSINISDELFEKYKNQIYEVIKSITINE